jgi:tryptophan-rich sensory protein
MSGELRAAQPIPISRGRRVDRGSTRKPLTVAALCALAVAVAGGVATDVGPWYRSLDRSSLTPPDWLFAPAWTLIYALAVMAAARGWSASRTPTDRALLVSLFFVNGVLNVMWSACFFTAQRPDWALAEVSTLWISVLVLILFLRPRSRRASLLMVPYLVWVSFAAYLNYVVVLRNGPFA